MLGLRAVINFGSCRKYDLMVGVESRGWELPKLIRVQNRSHFFLGPEISKVNYPFAATYS